MEMFNSRFSELKDLGTLVMSCVFSFTLNHQGSHLLTHFTQGQTQQRLQENQGTLGHTLFCNYQRATIRHALKV